MSERSSHNSVARGTNSEPLDSESCQKLTFFLSQINDTTTLSMFNTFTQSTYPTTPTGFTSNFEIVDVVLNEQISV